MRAIKEIADRTEGKPAKATYLHHPNGEITIEYENGWQPPDLEMERGDAWDEKEQVLYPDGSIDRAKSA